MKIMQINAVYGKGSTGKITKDIHDTLLTLGYESVVLYGRGTNAVQDPNVYKVSSEFGSKVRKAYTSVSGMPYKCAFSGNGKIEKYIEKEQPDIVHLQCINGFFVDIYRLVKYLKKHNIPTVLTVHADFMYTGGCGVAMECEKWMDGCSNCKRLKEGLGVVGFDRTKKNFKMMQDSFSDFDNLTVVGVSRWTADRAKKSAILGGFSTISIYNGIETDNVFYPRNNLNTYKKYNIPNDKKIILTVVPNLTNESKGGKAFIDFASKNKNDKYVFVVVGAKDAFEKYSEVENTIIIPYTENQIELAEIYSKASVFVTLSTMDNYPTVCIEANSCGTPVVGYDVGGVKETIFEGMGETVMVGDINALMQRAFDWAERKPQISKETLAAARYRNSKQRMVSDYIELYKRMLSEEE